MAHFPLTCHGCHEQDKRALLDFKSSLDDPANRLSSWQDSYQHQNCCNWHGVVCSYNSARVISINLRNTVLENYLIYYDSSVNFDPPNTSLQGKFSPSLFNSSHIEYIDLAYNDFQGTQIPLELSNLTKLSHLDLSHAIIGSSVSKQFDNLSSLYYLDLSGNYQLQSSSLKWVIGLVNLQVLKLSGIYLDEAASLEENFDEHMSHLSNLRDLNLSGCSISSTYFPSFHNLSLLSSLDMGNNPELNSQIPVQLANLTSLSTLYLSGCGLQGYVPHLPQLKELDVSDNPNLNPNLTRMFQCQWPKLQKLFISHTNINGSILNSVSNTPMLVSLDAKGCSIQGSVPSWIYNLSHLQSLDLSGNDIGYIHFSSLSNLKFLSVLRLSYNNLQGSVPKSISNLKFLTILDLSNNKFQDSIPKSISNLKFLNILDLSNNEVQGSIPISICKILSLRQLSLESNNITGTIPSCISKLHNLTVFSVYENSIGGNVSLISLINDLELTTIDLSSNRLTVVIDQNFSLYSKFKLESLSVPSCNLKGLFPTFICELSNLYHLDLSHNYLTGVVPSCISNLKNLYSFHISNNQFHGPLPLVPQSFDTYFSFDASNNQLSGEISVETGNRISSFLIINLAGNKISGSIPSSICSKVSRSNLQIIDLSNNKFSGVIPNTLGYCGHLVSLNLGSNNLTGNIPDEIQNLESLGYLQLNDNSLGGDPLSFISKIQGLEVLNLANNHFQGRIPIELFGDHPDYSHLRILSLRSNKFNGSIPIEINNLSQLQILDLSNNKLSGHIPKLSVWNLMNSTSGYPEMLRYVFETQSQTSIKDEFDIQLQMVINGIMLPLQQIYSYTTGMDLSCNMFDGSIPTEIGLLKGLARLNLSHNLLSGNIPASIGDLRNLVSLDLSFNRISGHIPQSLTSLDFLGFLNLSYNELSGKIPRGIHFDTLGVDGWAFVGNELSFGEPTKKSSESEEGDQKDAREKLMLYGVIFLGFGVGFWGLFFVMLIKKEKLWFPYWRFIDLIVAVIIRRT